MTWRRRTGIVTATGRRATRVTAFLDERKILSIVESHDAAFESLHLTIATDDQDRVATFTADGTIAGGPELEEFAQNLANHVDGEVSLRDQTWVGEGVRAHASDPFEQSLGADIAAFADRAVVFTRASEQGLIDIASQVEDVIYALGHLDGHALAITEGPILTTLQWEEDTRPALIIEQGAASPSVTVVPIAVDSAADPHAFIWGSIWRLTPTPILEAAQAAGAASSFIDATLGAGAFVRELMKVFPAVEPGAVREALSRGLVPFLGAVGLPEELRGYLESETEASELPGAEEVHPASFARSVRRVVTEASTTVSERAEAMRQRAVAVRTRAETAFDAAEVFAEEVVLPVRQNWVNPALAISETTLGVLALRKAREVGGVAGGVLGAGGVLLLGDAVVNSVISLAPLLRRKN